MLDTTLRIIIGNLVIIPYVITCMLNTGQSLCKRLQHARATLKGAVEELANLIVESNGLH